MREIKFRAWDKNNKEWWNNWSHGYFLSLEGDFLKDIPGDAGEIESIEKSEDARDRFILCQYTGLKDKNGKEIYEGDIVSGRKICAGNSCCKYRCVVWKDNYFGLEPYDLLDDLRKSHLYEIVGNIYENPEII